MKPHVFSCDVLSTHGRGLRAQHRIGENSILELSCRLRIVSCDIFLMNFFLINNLRAIRNLSGAEIVE